jgi:hypothetical protein
MQLRYLAVAASLFAFGCNNGAKEASKAAAAKSAEAVEIDTRAKAIAENLVQKAADDADKKQQAAKLQKADARRQLQQAAIDHPEKFLESSKLQMVEQGKRRLTSIALTNNSKFSMTDIRGTLDFHGENGLGQASGIMAQLPIELTGSIPPGGSMVFSEQQHTLSGSSITLPKAPSSASFTVTRAKVGSEGIDETAVPAIQDGGAGDGGSP